MHSVFGTNPHGGCSWEIFSVRFRRQALEESQGGRTGSSPFPTIHAPDESERCQLLE